MLKSRLWSLLIFGMILRGPGFAQEKIAAEAEATATKGPIQLTLRLYKKKIKSYDRAWYQIRLKNVGKKKIIIQDPIFFNPYAIRDESRHQRGTYLEALNSHGKHPIIRLNDVHPDMLNEGEGKPLPEELQKRMKPRFEYWRSKGLSEGEIGIKVTEEFRHEIRGPQEPKPYIWLAPGASTTTIACAYYDEMDFLSQKPRPKPIGEFSDLQLFFLPPGKYRIRAVYDHEWSQAMIKDWHIKPDIEDVRVKTPFISLEVVYP